MRYKHLFLCLPPSFLSLTSDCLFFPLFLFPLLTFTHEYSHTQTTHNIYTQHTTHTHKEHGTCTHTRTQNTHHTNLLTQNMLRRRLCSLPRYPDLAVREFAVDSLGRLPADELVHFLPQLIQVGIMWCNIYAQHIN